MHHHGPALDVPVDQDPAAAVAGVPLGEDVLVPGPEVGGVRRDRSRPGAPQGLAPDGEGGVRDLDRDLVGGLAGQVAAPGVAQLLLAVRVPAASGLRADAGVRAVDVDLLGDACRAEQGQREARHQLDLARLPGQLPPHA